MSERGTFVTAQQQHVHDLYIEHRSMSVVGRTLGLSQIRVREALVQWQRNQMRDRGEKPPPLREMLRGDVTPRFGVARNELGGRPAKHEQHDPAISSASRSPTASRFRKLAARAASGSKRIVVAAAEAGARVHGGFWRNLQAYAAKRDAELVVLQQGSVGLLGEGADGVRERVCREGLDFHGVVDVAADVRANLQSIRPLDGLRGRNSATWMVVGHGAVQLETLPRIRAHGLRVQITTGAITMPREGSATARPDLGAVTVEIDADGAAHCRHLLAAADGDGAFQDLRLRVKNGIVSDGCRVEALTFGDVHHAHLDPAVSAATWGTCRRGQEALVDYLRPRNMIFHDVHDFAARNSHDGRNHHKRFDQFVRGGGDVRAELLATVGFLETTRREWARSIVVGSNHDDELLRWLQEADFREDPLNAIFFLEASLALYRRLAAGKPMEGMFEHVLRRLSSDGLSGVRFLRPEESLMISGVENAIHGHRFADGRRGAMQAFERLGIRATLGHVHRPMTRDGIYTVGVCQTDLSYAKGPLTAWAVGHVATYSTGARQHLFFNGGRFHA